MNQERIAGVIIIILALLGLWWLMRYGLGFLHGDQVANVSATVGGIPVGSDTTVYSGGSCSTCGG